MDNHIAAKNIQKISLLFFIVIGAIHLSSGALFFQQSTPDLSQIVFKTSFIPFIITGLTYGFSSFQVNYTSYSNTQETKKINTILIATGIILVTLLTAIFFFVPNLTQ